MRRHRTLASLLALVALLIELFSPVAYAAMLPHRDGNPTPGSVSLHQVAVHESCAAGMAGEAAATQAPVVPVGHICNHCGDGVCHMLACVPAIPTAVPAAIASRETIFPSCSARGYTNRTTESLYRPPAVSL